MSDRNAKRKHLLRLGDAAIALVDAKGRVEGNIEYRGQLTRIRSFEERRIGIEYWAPRHPAGLGGGYPKPAVYLLTVKFNGQRVLQLGWEGERFSVIRYEPGAWENLIA